MKPDKNILKIAFKLNYYESAVLDAIMNKKKASAGDISTFSQVPRSRVYDVAESLKFKGLIKSKKQDKKPLLYTSLPIEKMMENTRKIYLDEANEKIKSMEKLLK